MEEFVPNFSGQLQAGNDRVLYVPSEGSEASAISRVPANPGVRGSYRGEKLGAESLSVVGFASRRPGFARPGGRA